MESLIIDALRFGHLLALALGLGLAMTADVSALGLVRKPVTTAFVARLETLHLAVLAGFAMLWLTGIALFYVRTGFDFSAASPKLTAKFAVVALLTLNAFLIGRIGLPTLQRCVGLKFGAFPFADRLKLSVVAALSTAGWFCALALGTFTALKSMPIDGITAILMPIYAVAVCGGVVLAVFSPVLAGQRNPDPDAQWDPRNAQNLGLAHRRTYVG